MPDLKGRIYNRRGKVREQLRKSQEEIELLEAWIGLDSLLAGAWGTENLDRLGGGKLQIERAFFALGRELDRRLAGVEPLNAQSRP